jgi:hypothetical protein
VKARPYIVWIVRWRGFGSGESKEMYTKAYSAEDAVFQVQLETGGDFHVTRVHPVPGTDPETT